MEDGRSWGKRLEALEGERRSHGPANPPTGSRQLPCAATAGAQLLQACCWVSLPELVYHLHFYYNWSAFEAWHSPMWALIAHVPWRNTLGLNPPLALSLSAIASWAFFFGALLLLICQRLGYMEASAAVNRQSTASPAACTPGRSAHSGSAVGSSIGAQPATFGGVHHYAIPGAFQPLQPEVDPHPVAGTLHVFLKAARWPDGHLRAKGFAVFEIAQMPAFWAKRKPPVQGAPLRNVPEVRRGPAGPARCAALQRLRSEPVRAPTDPAPWGPGSRALQLQSAAQHVCSTLRVYVPRPTPGDALCCPRPRPACSAQAAHRLRMAVRSPSRGWKREIALPTSFDHCEAKSASPDFDYEGCVLEARNATQVGRCRGEAAPRAGATSGGGNVGQQRPAL